MITKINSFGFQANQYSSLNKAKNISFKEAECYDFAPLNSREEIENKYNRKRCELASKADWTGMPSDIYFEELQKIEEAERHELDIHDSYIRAN